MSDGVQEIQWPWESSWCWRTASRTQGLRNGVYDKLRRGWAEKFHTVENNEEIGSALVPHTDEHRDKNEASASCIDLQLGWALHKPRSQAVRFTDEVKQYLTTRFELGERTGNKADPGKVAAGMRTSRNPDGSRMFERKDWLTKSQVQGFVSRLAATRRRQGNQEKQVEDVYAEEEEQERHGVLEKVSAQLSPRHQFAMIPIACATSHETRNWTVSV